MKNKALNILMLEDNAADARLIRELLNDVPDVQYSIEQVDRVSQGIERLKRNSIDVVLLDLGLRDSQGMETLSSLTSHVTRLPIIVMTGLDDEAVAVKAVQKGAQDYLVKGQVEGNMLWRSLRYAVERKKAQQQNELSLKILKILNKPGEQKEIIRMILMLIKEFSGFQAVGIRLKEGNDYPYYAFIGFPAGHVEAENSLCVTGERGLPVLDADGIPMLECMCGNVIRMHIPTLLPCYSEGGSFWINCSSDLLKMTTREELQGHTRNTCSREGYQSIALIPLKTDKGNIGLLQLCDFARDRFTAEFINYLEGIAQSIGVVLGRMKEQKKLLGSYAALKKTFNDAINTLVRVVEMRDPYTAGHQQRVAGLSIAIARELGLDEINIEQLRMAAVVHDVGKIYIPADLLSKPGKLNPLEFQMIQTHATGGFDIVKGMDFPCVVAQCILQHHERLDGSGYPNGLIGDQIIREAKIIAVADVVEAMASHRPYRPALGLDRAIEEITSGSGVLYDEEAVSACRHLLLEKGFRFD